MNLRTGWMKSGVMLSGLLLCVACASTPAPSPAVDTVPSGPAAGSAQTLTAEQCEEKGGTVVGDIGDGRIHTEGCPDGGTLLGNVPLGIEGSICCKK
jgi:hypothetical protein